MCFDLRLIEPSKKRLGICVNILKWLALAQLVVAITVIVLKISELGFYMLIGIVILWSAWFSRSPFACVIYIVFICGISILSLVSNLILPIQLMNAFFQDKAGQITRIIIILFFLKAIYLTFIIYKEFKVAKVEVEQVGFGFLPTQQNFQDQSNQQRPIQGVGQAIGGAVYTGQINRYQYGANIQYQDNPIVQTDHHSQNYNNGVKDKGSQNNLNPSSKVQEPFSNNSKLRQIEFNNQPIGPSQIKVSSSLNNSQYFIENGVQIG